MSAPSDGPHRKLPRWIVLGASGFVGSAIVAELLRRGEHVMAMAAPRLSSDASNAAALVAEAAHSPAVDSLAEAFSGAEFVINAAGLATPGEGSSPAMMGANGLLPAVIALAARQAGVRRFVHLSSASVQGHRRMIDESGQRAPFSAYSRTKALGEEVLELLATAEAGSTGGLAPVNVVSIRATSVQGPCRPTTRSLVKVASSALASVAAPGTAPTPVSSIDALAWFVVQSALFTGPVPPLVLQPWEGLSVSEVLRAAGGRAPVRLPKWFCHGVLSAGYFISRMLGERLHGPIRRVELMWFGQGQEPGWAESAGLIPTPAIAHVLEQARLSLR
ncbi:uncharacterized protein YbjT (DUF2867 family) [Arthrobacter sp. UYCu511]|uniref:NAD-dependent epimerase/dehydratase family protein n=1 Tax=Arthrobacter sp. UYCu511 TaxID=3156337 RepID=UPI003395234D